MDLKVTKAAVVCMSVARQAKESGMRYDEFVRVTAPEFGAVFRENAIDGWRPVQRIVYGDVDIPDDAFRPEAIRRRVGNKMVSESELAKRKRKR